MTRFGKSFHALRRPTTSGPTSSRNSWSLVISTAVSLRAWELKLAPLQPLVVDRQPVAVPPQNLHQMPALVAEHEQAARERIAAEERCGPLRPARRRLFRMSTGVVATQTCTSRRSAAIIARPSLRGRGPTPPAAPADRLGQSQHAAAGQFDHDRRATARRSSSTTTGKNAGRLERFDRHALHVSRCSIVRRQA